MRVSNGMLNVNTGEIDNFGIEAEINWQITDSWKISAQYSWLHMERPILASPEHKVSTTVYYSKERWTASTDLQYVHGLYTSLDSHAREKFLLWNAVSIIGYIVFYVYLPKEKTCWHNDTR